MHSQGDKKNNLEWARLDKLRSVTGRTWDSIAADLGIKRAMIHHVKAGRRGFSEKTRQRLLECEVAAGIRSEASALIEQELRGADLVSVLLQGQGGGQSEVSTKDIDRGEKEFTWSIVGAACLPDIPKYSP